MHVSSELIKVRQDQEFESILGSVVDSSPLELLDEIVSQRKLESNPDIQNSIDFI